MTSTCDIGVVRLESRTFESRKIGPDRIGFRGVKEGIAQGKMSSIIPGGNSKFDECLTWAKQGQSTANFKLCAALECKTLYLLWVNAGNIDGSQNAHKKRKWCKNTNV